MYLLFKRHNISPSTYHNLKEGEKRILRAFAIKENEERNKIFETISIALNNSGLLGGG